MRMIQRTGPPVFLRGELVNDSIVSQMCANRLKQKNFEKENKRCRLLNYRFEQKAAIQCKVLL